VGTQASFVLLEHTDHVTTLATAPAAGVLATGGLSSQLFLWDIQTATRLQQVGLASSSSILKQQLRAGAEP